MIEKITLEGFTGTGEANYEGKGKEYAHFSSKKKKMYFGHNSTYIGREPTIFCMRGFFDILYRSGMVPGPREP